jgi:hypothetical protein
MLDSQHMSINKTQERNIKIFMTVIAVFVLIGIIVYMLSSSNKPVDVPVDNNDNTVEDLNGNKVVIQNENSYSAEGRAIPSDIDLSGMIPAQLKEQYLVGVVDNKQLDSRNITLKYKIEGTADSVADSLVNDMTAAGWQVSSQSSYINATKANNRIAVSLEQVDEESVYVTLLVYLFNPAS